MDCVKDQRERRNRRAINGTGSDRETKVETISVSGINTEQIYEGERIENKKLKPLKVLEKRLRMAVAKIYKMIEKVLKMSGLKLQKFKHKI